MLRYVQRRGNSTVYEWRTGTEPSVVERPHLEEPPEPVEEDAVRQAWRELLPWPLHPTPPPSKCRTPEGRKGDSGERAQS